jgi:putative transposase
MNDWPHAPIHRLQGDGTFFVTGSMYRKQHYASSRKHFEALQEIMFAEANEHECTVQSWCLLSNHYHVVARCQDGERLRLMLSRFHAESAIELNHLDGTPKRKVWFQFFDKTLTFERSWLARLRYTNENAVHHGIVERAIDYKWCSAAYFERNVSRAFVETLRRVNVDVVSIYDDFDCSKAAALPPQS